MTYPQTHTHTSYFSSEDLNPISAEYEKLWADWMARREHLSADVVVSGDKRLWLLKNAIYFLLEDAN